MNRDFIIPSGSAYEYISVTVYDVSGAGAALKATYYKNGAETDSAIISANDITGRDVRFHFLIVSYSGSSSIWRVSSGIKKVFNDGISSAYTGFKVSGEDLYSDNYKNNLGVTVCNAFPVEK